MSAVLLYFSLCFTVLQNSLFCNAVTASVDKLQQKQERHMWILSNLLQSISHTRVTLSYDSKCTRQPCSFAVVTIETHTYRVHWYIDSIAKLSCLNATEQGLVPWRHQNVYWDKNLGSFCIYCVMPLAGTVSWYALTLLQTSVWFERKMKAPSVCKSQG